MAIVLTINAADKTNQIDSDTFTITQQLTKQNDQMEFIIKNYGTKTYAPVVGDEVIFTFNSTRLFAGHVTQNTVTTDGIAKYNDIIVNDYSSVLDSLLVSKTYTNMMVVDIISDLLTNFSDGTFTTNNVNVNATIDTVVFNYVSLSECFKKLISLLPNYDWYVDYNKDIHFFQIGTVMSPFNLTDNGGNFLFNSLQIVSDISQLVNHVIIKGGKVAGSAARTEYFSGDATSTNFALANDFIDTPVVTVGGSPQTVGIDGVDQDSAFECMWNQNSQSIRFTAGNIPGSGTNNIVVTATPRFPLLYEKENQASIKIYGKKDKLLHDATIIDNVTASSRADAELAAYSLPIGTAQFNTYTDGLIVGQLINITSTIYGINQNYKIQQVTTTIRSATQLVYAVQLITTNAVDITDVLNLLLIQNPAAQLPSDPNTVIQRVMLFEESMAITDAIHAPTQTAPPYVWDTMKWGLSTWG